MTELPDTSSPDSIGPANAVRWGRVYALVVLFAVITMLGLWFFSNTFTP